MNGLNLGMNQQSMKLHWKRNDLIPSVNGLDTFASLSIMQMQN